MSEKLLYTMQSSSYLPREGKERRGRKRGMELGEILLNEVVLLFKWVHCNEVHEGLFILQRNCIAVPIYRLHLC